MRVGQTLTICPEIRERRGLSVPPPPTHCQGTDWLLIDEVIRPFSGEPFGAVVEARWAQRGEFGLCLVYRPLYLFMARQQPNNLTSHRVDVIS